MKRAALGFFLAGAALLLVGQAPPALAHTELILSTPDDGATLDAAPAEVVLTFSEDLLPNAVTVSATGSDGAVVTFADPVVDGSDVTVPWPVDLPGPGYQVNYRVVSQDGHPVTGSIGFTVTTASATASAAASAAASAESTAPATPAPPLAAAEQGGEGVPGAVIVAGALVLLGVGVGATWAVRRTRP